MSQDSFLKEEETEQFRYETQIEEYHEENILEFSEQQSSTIKNISLNKLPITIDGFYSDQYQELKKWKELLSKHIEYLQKQRAQNNKLRNKLKQLGEEAEKLIQSSIRKQKVQEYKYDNKHQYMIEQKIVSLIISKQKTIHDFSDQIPSQILTKLIEIYEKQIQNQALNEEIRSIRDKNKNLDQIDQINELTNQLKNIKETENSYQNELIQLEKVIHKQESDLDKKMKNCNYQNKINSLTKEIKDAKDKLKQLIKEEQANAKREIEQNQVKFTLQKIYRDACKFAGVKLEDQIFLVREKDKEFISSSLSELTKDIFQQNQIIYLKKQQKQKEDIHNSNEMDIKLKEFRINPNQKFIEIQQQIHQLQIKIDDVEKLNQRSSRSKQDEILRIQEENNQLQKKLRQKDFECKGIQIKINEISRTLSLQEKKIQSIYVKPSYRQENIQFGIITESDTSLSFDDSKCLDWNSNLQLRKIFFYLNSEQMIIGIEVHYGNDIINKIQKHLSLEVVPKEIIQLGIDSEDQITSISGIYNEHQILYIKIETKKHKQIAVGNVSLKNKQLKDFKILLRDKILISFNGILDFTEESSTIQERFLVALGVTFKQKEKNQSSMQQQKKESIERSTSKQSQLKESKKMIYPFKKITPKNVQIIKSQPALNQSPNEQNKSQYKEKDRIYKTKLGINQSKNLNYVNIEQLEYERDDREKKEKNALKQQEQIRRRVKSQYESVLPQIDQKQILLSQEKTMVFSTSKYNQVQTPTKLLSTKNVQKKF